MKKNEVGRLVFQERKLGNVKRHWKREKKKKEKRKLVAARLRSAAPLVNFQAAKAVACVTLVTFSTLSGSQCCTQYKVT